MLLRPAFTDKELDNKYQEEAQTIIYKRSLDPKRLNDGKFTGELWKTFMAFSECTHLYGQPSFLQKWKFWKLKNFYMTIIESALHNSRFFRQFSKLVGWVITVGLSGILLFAVQNCFQQDPAIKPNVKVYVLPTKEIPADNPVLLKVSKTIEAKNSKTTNSESVKKMVAN